MGCGFQLSVLCGELGRRGYYGKDFVSKVSSLICTRPCTSTYIRIYNYSTCIDPTYIDLGCARLLRIAPLVLFLEVQGSLHQGCQIRICPDGVNISLELS